MPEIEFSLRDFFHPVAIARLKRDFGRNQWRPLDEWREWRESRLREVVRRAVDETAFYRHRFASHGLRPEAIRGESDLAQMPLLTREAVRRAGVELHARNAPKQGARATLPAERRAIPCRS